LSDVRDRLHDAVVDLEPAWSTPEKVRQVVMRRQRRARLRAGVVAGVIAVAAVAVTVTALREVPKPAVTSGPLDVSALELAWRAEFAPSLLGESILADDHQLYVLGADGVAAYPKDCADPCTPAWRASTPRHGSRALLRTSFALGDGVVFVTTGKTLLAFDAACSGDGARCAPLWEAVPPDGGRYVDAPVAWGRSVRVMWTLGGEGNSNGVIAAGYSVDGCGSEGSCLPEWTVELGPGPRYVPGTVVDGVFYQQVGDHLTGIDPAACGISGLPCDPVFRVEALGDERTQAGSLYGPVAAGGELLVASGDGNVYAYAARCGTICEPLWLGRAADYLEGEPVVAGDVVTVVVRSELVAFPVGCRTDGGECDSAWRASIDDYGVVRYADSEHLVLIEHLKKHGSVNVFPTACDRACRPLWTAELSGEAQGATGDADHVFIASSDGRVSAYPLECSGACSPSWTTTVEGGGIWNMSSDADGLYAEASSAASSSAWLYGFRVDSDRAGPAATP
jgi:hypothetical protein